MKSLILSVALLLVVAGCSKAPGPVASSQPEVPATNVTQRELALPTKAQPKLQAAKLYIGPAEIKAELAHTMQQLQTGMMFRTNVNEDEGMLLMFSVPHRAGFWMKNTPVPLSAGYIDPDGVLLEIHKLEPFNTNTVFAGSDRVQYVLETAQGWFERHSVHEGMVIRTESGTLRHTFLR